MEWVKRAIPVQVPEKWRPKASERVEGAVAEAVDGIPAGYDHGVREAEQLNAGDNASTFPLDRRALCSSAVGFRTVAYLYTGIWTQLVLAYAIHKSFIFIRVPLAASITPKVVKMLRARGWNIGKRTPKVEREAAKAAHQAQEAAKAARKS